jgi:DNA/RNA endonuclease YhcR with UshA esterase domain
MKKILIALAVTFFSSIAFAQKEIKSKEAVQHIGDSVSVTAKVFNVKTYDNDKEKLVLLNLGAAYPDQHLTIVIDRKQIQKVDDIDITTLKGADVIVMGKIELYKGKPAIIIHDESQLGVVVKLDIPESAIRQKP